MALQIRIVTPRGVLLDSTTETVIAPGVEGDFQVMPGHLPLFTPLRLGELWLDAQGTSRVAVFGGVAEVAEDRVNILADNAELAAKIDLERAEKARERAQQRLERARTADHIDVKRAEAALQRALLRIRTSRKSAES